MNYKTGDKVRIRSWKSMKDEFGLTDEKEINVPNYIFRIKMKITCEKIVTIDTVTDYSYMVVENLFVYTDNMLEHSSAPKIDIKATLINIAGEPCDFVPIPEINGVMPRIEYLCRRAFELAEKGNESAWNFIMKYMENM